MGQKLLNLDSKATSSTKSTFSKDPTKTSVEAYFGNNSKFWEEKEINTTIESLDNTRYHTCTASEWKILQLGFLKLLLSRKEQDVPCDYLLAGTAWHHDETHLRHLSFGNWGTLEAKEKTNWNDLYDVASSSHVDDFAKGLVESIHAILKEHGLMDVLANKDLIEGTILQLEPYPKDTESFIWKLISGAISDWQQMVTDHEGEDYDSINGDDPPDDGCLFMLYFNNKKELKVRELIAMYTTEPTLVTDGGHEIHWNH
jgi:hypothetical protein